MFAIDERANDAWTRALAFLVRLHAATIAATSIFDSYSIVRCSHYQRAHSKVKKRRQMHRAE